MAWKTMDVREQRVRFVVAAARREKPLVALCREFEISRPTGYLWLKRYEEGGSRDRRTQPAPAPQSGRTPAELEERVVQVRKQYPDWGARKLKVVLDARKCN